MLRRAGCAHGGGAELLAWANSKAAGSSGIRIARFDDPRLHNGVFLLHVLRAVAPEALDPKAFHLGSTQEHAHANAELCVRAARAALARAPGGGGEAAHERGYTNEVVLAEWSDLVECRPKLVRSASRRKL